MEEILNFVQLTDLVGTAGQPAAEQIDAIAAAGYATVINLAMHDSDNALPDEGSLVAKAGMTYIHMPVDFAAPELAHAERFFQAHGGVGWFKGEFTRVRFHVPVPAAQRGI